MWYLVCAHIGMPPREYTHYICERRENADRLAAILDEKRPNLRPIYVVEHDPTPDQLRRGVRFADNSKGPIR
jgi:hypothetical protein